MEDTSNVVLTWATYLPFIKKFIYLSYEAFGKYTLQIIQHLNDCIKQYYAKKGNEDGQIDRKETILDFMLEEKDKKGTLSELQVMGEHYYFLTSGFINAILITLPCH